MRARLTYSPVVADGDPGARVGTQLGRLLLRTNRSVLYGSLVDGITGVDETTYPVLSGLARVGPTTATDLSSAVGLDRSAVTRYLSRLESAGLVVRSADGTDARATRVDLTPKGRRTVDAMRRRLDDTLDDILNTWSEVDAERFAVAFERFVTALLERGE
jgi:DNA-binding MarR family transcriptional regulator